MEGRRRNGAGGVWDLKRWSRRRKHAIKMEVYVGGCSQENKWMVDVCRNLSTGIEG